MKYFLDLTVVLLFIITCANNLQAQPNFGSVTIKISSVNDDQGIVRIALVTRKQYLNDKASPLKRESAQIKDGKAEIRLNQIPFGVYGIQVYHDLNNNGKLDRKKSGTKAVTEPYGFSNNAKAIWGPPFFGSVKFELNEKKPHVEQNIQLKKP